MYSLRKARRARSRGQSVVEFALILPVLITLLLVTLDFGRLFMSYITLTNTTRVAANYGALNPGNFTGTPDTATYDTIVDRERAGLNCDLQADGGGHIPPIPTFQANALGSTTGLGASSIVSMQCNFSMITPFMTNFFGGPLPIAATAQFPIRTGAIANIGGTTILPPPGAPLAGFDFTGVSGGTINGSGNVSGVGSVSVNVADTSSNAQTWDWNWGDGSAHEFGSGPFSHAYSVPATYTVTQIVTNPAGSSQTSRTVTVTAVSVPPPVAAFYGTPVGSPPQANGGGSSGAAITGSRPLVVQFTNQSTNGSAYSWDFGDGTPPVAGNGPQHQYSTLGVFSVTLTVTSPSGGNPITRSSYVTTGCVVPNFANTSTAAAQSTWTGAGFTGTITYQPDTANGNSQTSTTAPSPAKNITSQVGVTGGVFVPATRQNAASPWRCAPDVKVRYTP